VLENIPEGVTISKLVYPMGKGELSTIILLGVKRRTMVHASYVYDFLETMNPSMVYVQHPPDTPLFIKTRENVDY
jgi:hypothetical protein